MAKVDLQKLKSYSKEELTSFFFSYIEKIYEDYKTILPRNKFSALMTSFLKDFITKLTIEEYQNLETIFNLKARNYLNNYLNNSDIITKAVKYFVKENIDVLESPIKELNKIVNYFKSINFFPNDVLVVNLIQNVPELKIILDNIVKQNSTSLELKGLSYIFRTELAVFIGEIYCDLYNVSYRNHISDEELLENITDDSFHTYLVEIGGIPLLSVDEEKRLGKILLEKGPGYEEAKKRFIEGNLRLVVSVAKRYSTYGAEFLDLIEEGNLGLMVAVDHFDVNKGYRFSTYATWWIMQAVTRAVAYHGRSLRIPLHVYEFFIKVRKAKKVLAQVLGRYPLDQEVADYLDVPLAKIEDFNKYGPDAVSIHDPYLNGSLEDGKTIEDFIVDENNSHIEEDILQKELATTLDNVMNKLLDERQIEILKRRFGFYGEPQTLEEVGQGLGITRERVRQLEKRALFKLHNNRESRYQLASFLSEEFQSKVEDETLDYEKWRIYEDYKKRIRSKDED